MGSLLNSILLLLLVVNGVLLVSAYVWDQEEDVATVDNEATVEIRAGGNPSTTQSFVAVLRVTNKYHGICLVYNTKYCLTIKAAVTAIAPTNGTFNRALTVHLAATGAERTSRRFYLDSGSDLALVEVCPSFPTGSAAVIAASTPAADTSVTYTTFTSMTGEGGSDNLTLSATKTVGEDCECDMHAKMETTSPKNTFCLRASSTIFSNWNVPGVFDQEVPGAYVFETSTSKVYGFIITAANSTTVSEVVYDLTKNSRSAFLALANAP